MSEQFSSESHPHPQLHRDPTEIAAALVEALGRSVKGKSAQIGLLVAGLLSGGHVLLEDLAGSGKTLLAKSLARATGGVVGRVQCTPELLPADIVGTSVWQPGSSQWQFHPGPVFANVLLVDEINRASPRAQAALLEPMEERQVTVDGATYRLPDPFFCIATQNPHGQVGTYPLPESQLDRFSLVFSLGWPDRDAAREILVGAGGVSQLPAVVAVTNPTELANCIAEVRQVHVAASLVDYLLTLVDATRHHRSIDVGVSPRVAASLLALARAHAVVCGRDFVTPEDFQTVFGPACAHRVRLGATDGASAAPAAAGIAGVPEIVAPSFGAAWNVLMAVLASVPVPER